MSVFGLRGKKWFEVKRNLLTIVPIGKDDLEKSRMQRVVIFNSLSFQINIEIWLFLNSCLTNLYKVLPLSLTLH